MKRNMDLVRRILLAMEAHEAGSAPSPFTIAGVDQDVIGHHVWLMEQGRLVTAATVTTHVWLMESPSPIAIPLTITWKGHDFLDAVRNDWVWSTVNTELKEHALTLPFTLLQDLALKILAAHVGLPPHR